MESFNENSYLIGTIVISGLIIYKTNILKKSV